MYSSSPGPGSATGCRVLRSRSWETLRRVRTSWGMSSENQIQQISSHEHLGNLDTSVLVTSSMIWRAYLDKSWASCCGDDPHLDHTLLHSDVCILTGSHTWRYLLFFFIRNSKIVNDEKNFIIFSNFHTSELFFGLWRHLLKGLKLKVIITNLVSAPNRIMKQICRNINNGICSDIPFGLESIFTCVEGQIFLVWIRPKITSECQSSRLKKPPQPKQLWVAQSQSVGSWLREGFKK